MSGGAGKLTGHFDEAEVPVSFRQCTASAEHKLGTFGATDSMKWKNTTCSMPVPCHSDSPINSISNSNLIEEEFRLMPNHQSKSRHNNNNNNNNAYNK